MVIIGGIIIDEFAHRQLNSHYILTHWHSDHYAGITNKLTYSAIHASTQTTRFLLLKYPGLKECVHEMPLEQPVRIGEAEVTAYDSNHMCGSIMLLIKIGPAYHFHTGDMRFNENILRNCRSLFKEDSLSCRYAIDTLHLDNTYCDPIFKFPSRSWALRSVVNLITEARPSHVFLCTDSIGKEEAFVLLANKYGTQIALSTQRMAYVQAMGDKVSRHFVLRDTKQAENCYFQVIRKGEIEEYLFKQKGAIAVTLTGWANIEGYAVNGRNSYVVPYSLHSSFRQLELLVSVMRPKHILPIVKQREGAFTKMPKGSSFESYVFGLMNIVQRGLPYLRRKYTEDKMERLLQ